MPSQQLGFYFGGMADASNFPIQTRNAPNLVHSNNLLRVNTAEQGTAKWIPEPLPTTSPNIRTRAEGGLVWIPAGEDGMLVAIGGTYNETSLHNTTYTRENPEVYNDFTREVALYDIRSGDWFTQNIRENSWYPERLVSFCAVAASNIDGGNTHRKSNIL